jgi:hypothetical protein
VRVIPDPSGVVEVPQRLFVRAARLAADSRFVSATVLQRRLQIPLETAEQVMLGLEGAGVVGPPALTGMAPVQVKPADLPRVFERFGIIEDAVPPDAEPH